MASKENQEALDTIYKKCNGDTDIIESLLTLQQANNDLELYKKAFELLSTDYFNSQGGYYFDNFETMKEKYLEKARKELENANH